VAVYPSRFVQGNYHYRDLRLNLPFIYVSKLDLLILLNLRLSFDFRHTYGSCNQPASRQLG